MCLTMLRGDRQLLDILGRKLDIGTQEIKKMKNKAIVNSRGGDGELFEKGGEIGVISG